MGSPNDAAKLAPALEMLERFGLTADERVVAAHSTLPVVGVPLSGGALNGVDALYATVQMPRGIPVATVAIDGAANAAILVVEMLAITDKTLADRLAKFRAEGAR